MIVTVPAFAVRSKTFVVFPFTTFVFSIAATSVSPVFHATVPTAFGSVASNSTVSPAETVRLVRFSFTLFGAFTTVTLIFLDTPATLSVIVAVPVFTPLIR